MASHRQLVLAVEGYMAAYKAAATDDSDTAIGLEIRTWNVLVDVAGRKEAIRIFWAFQETLPVEHRSDVDPFGE